MEMNGGTRSPKETVTVVISSDGRVTVKVQGVDRPSCVDLTKYLEESLGQVTDREFTSEYYKAQRVTNAERTINRKDA